MVVSFLNWGICALALVLNIDLENPLLCCIFYHFWETGKFTTLSWPEYSPGSVVLDTSTSDGRETPGSLIFLPWASLKNLNHSTQLILPHQNLKMDKLSSSSDQRNKFGDLSPGKSSLSTILQLHDTGCQLEQLHLT